MLHVSEVVNGKIIQVASVRGDLFSAYTGALDPEEFHST